ncbi:unnamed protein product [Gadus morhua 'NCC']
MLFKTSVPGPAPPPSISPSSQPPSRVSGYSMRSPPPPGPASVLTGRGPAPLQGSSLGGVRPNYRGPHWAGSGPTTGVLTGRGPAPLQGSSLGGVRPHYRGPHWAGSGPSTGVLTGRGPATLQGSSNILNPFSYPVSPSLSL